MLNKISTPVLIAILLYHGFQFYTEWRLQKNILEHHAVVRERQHHNKQVVIEKREERIVKVSEHIYMAINYALGNSIMLIGDTGIVIVDTTESLSAAQLIHKAFREITDKPLKGVIYTHNHVDHILGTTAFIQDKIGVEVWAHHTFMEHIFHTTCRVDQAYLRRGRYQFGLNIDDVTGFRGIGYKTRGITIHIEKLIYPNKLMYKKKQKINIAGIDLELLHIPGETNDQIAVYWPKHEAVMCGDNFYRTFPNLYAIRGSEFRSLKLWFESIDIMRNLKPKYLVPSHTVPIIGKKEVYSNLTEYRDAIQLVHDQTVRFINQGFHPDEIANMIELPKKLKENPYLYELYGTVKWSSKGLFSGYMGWFSGDIVELNPHTPTEQAKRLVKLGGGVDNVVNEAEKALSKNDAQWALRLSSAVLRVSKDHKMGKEVKGKALIEMASQQTSMNGRNFYLTNAYEVNGKIDSIRRNKEDERKIISNARFSDLLYIIGLKLKAKECSTLDKVYLFKFPDTKEDVMFHIRNGIMDTSGTYTRLADVTVTVDSVVWRNILSKSDSLSSVTSVKPSRSDLQELLSCFDLI